MNTNTDTQIDIDSHPYGDLTTISPTIISKKPWISEQLLTCTPMARVFLRQSRFLSEHSRFSFLNMKL